MIIQIVGKTLEHTYITTLPKDGQALHKLPDAVAAHLHMTQTDLCLNLVAFGHGHLPHIVSQARDLQILQLESPPRRRVSKPISVQR